MRTHFAKACYNIFYEAASGRRGPGAQAGHAQAGRGLSVWTHGCWPSELGPKWAWIKVIRFQLVQDQVLLCPMPIMCEFGGPRSGRAQVVRSKIISRIGLTFTTPTKNGPFTWHLHDAVGLWLTLVSVARVGAVSQESNPHG